MFVSILFIYVYMYTYIKCIYVCIYNVLIFVDPESETEGSDRSRSPHLSLSPPSLDDDQDGITVTRQQKSRSCGGAHGQTSRERGRGRSQLELTAAEGGVEEGREEAQRSIKTFRCGINPKNPHIHLKFSGDLPNPKGIAIGVTDPLACFHLFLPHEVYDDILYQTNLYATQEKAKKGDTKPWTPITKPELMAFIGMNIAMGIVSLPTLKQYWSTDQILGHPWFRNVMCRDRFMEILRYFHIVDNTSAPSRSDPDYNKLWKIQPLITVLQQTCYQMYSPHIQLSIDESMIGTKCRHSFLQYIKNKPVKWGVKVWVCSDSVNGYICSFKIYTGKDSTGSPHSNGLGYAVVTSLVEKYENKGYVVYTDNFYTSPQLCKDLLTKGFYSTGTIRTNRKNFPVMLTQKRRKCERGDCTFSYHDHITAVKWHDNRDVFAMSTFVSDKMTTVKRRKDSGPRELI